ncbi:hypothetical protein [Streptomyces venezuelae]|uniref:hypothetical protein n=1 Tax=Streptomyces venezuelae TaxID=54571 RepID=UPI0034270C5C
MATSTPRLDSLIAEGTHDAYDGVRLADGHVFTLIVRPGAQVAEVSLFPGLAAPDTEGWENKDHWEVLQTGGEASDGPLYLEVPVQAVRDLIVQHGGEHEDQEAPWHRPARVGAVAGGTTDSVPTAGSVLCAALVQHGLTACTDGMSPSYAIALDPATPAQEVYERPYLAVADRAPAVDHDPDTHTGWVVWLHDENSEPVGAPLYTGGDGELVDCAADSAAAATAIADWLAEFELFTVDGTAYGPYVALRVPAGWDGYDEISVTRSVAAQIVDDLNVRDAGCGLTAAWQGVDLVFTWNKGYRGDEGGSETVVPWADGLYRIGGLWPWARR